MNEGAVVVVVVVVGKPACDLFCPVQWPITFSQRHGGRWRGRWDSWGAPTSLEIEHCTATTSSRTKVRSGGCNNLMYIPRRYPFYFTQLCMSHLAFYTTVLWAWLPLFMPKVPRTHALTRTALLNPIGNLCRRARTRTCCPPYF